MIYVFGDSHSMYSFANIPGVQVYHIGPVTLKRIGNPEDVCLSNVLHNLILTSQDVLLFCFGEIDMRCWVKIHLARHKGDLQSMFQNWINLYLDKITTLNANGASLGVVSITPPVAFENANKNPFYPVDGTDIERSEFVASFNNLLSISCQSKGFLYVDIYSSYRDSNGMLPQDMSDGHVHIGNNSAVHKLLIQLNLL